MIIAGNSNTRTEEEILNSAALGKTNQTGENIGQPIIANAMFSVESDKEETNRDDSIHNKSFDNNSSTDNESINNKSISSESTNNECNNYKTIYGR